MEIKIIKKNDKGQRIHIIMSHQFKTKENASGISIVWGPSWDVASDSLMQILSFF